MGRILEHPRWNADDDTIEASTHMFAVDITESDYEVTDSDEEVVGETEDVNEVKVNDAEGRQEALGRDIPTTLRSSSAFHPADLAHAIMGDSRDSAQDRAEDVGPHPSFLSVAEPYIFEQKIQASLKKLNGDPQKEDAMRFQGVAWIDNVRKALQMSVDFNIFT